MSVNQMFQCVETDKMTECTVQHRCNGSLSYESPDKQFWPSRVTGQKFKPGSMSAVHMDRFRNYEAVTY